MSIPQSLLGVTYQIPESGERPWGAVVTTYLRTIGIILDALATSTSGGSPILRLPVVSLSISAGGTVPLASMSTITRISGASSPITLSTTTAIEDGTSSGQILILFGNDVTNTVTIQDGSNTQLNGDAVLGLNECLILYWDSGATDWIEIARSH